MHAIESKAQRSQSATLTAGADNASGTHRPGHYIRGFCRARDRLRVEGDLAVAGSAEHAGEPGGRRFASSRSARDRPPRAAGGDGAALCAAQATAAVELRRAGLSPGGFGLVSGLCPLAAGLVAKEIGAAPDDQCDPAADLGGSQSGGVGQRQTGQAGKRRHGADRQHGHRDADARAERQCAVVGCRAPHDAAVAASDGVAGSASAALARSPAPGQEARAGDRVQPQQRQPPPALSRADCRYSGHQVALQQAGDRLAHLTGSAAARWRAQLGHYLPLIERILPQSQRRGLDGQTMPAREELVSLFEPHADIIVKGARDVQYGHKLNLATGQSGLILDVVVEAGNPADAERFLPMLDRQITRCGAPPRQVAADGGYASQNNLTAAKARGVTDVAFHKKRGLAVEDMVKSRWVYRKLRNFRAGIEAGISCLKRAYGLARCTWRGLDHFKTYIWSAVVAHNLVLLARLKPA